MTVEQFDCYVQGHSDYIVDLQQIAAESGYWSAYYSHAKHPKSVSKIFEQIRNKLNSKKQQHTSQMPDVDTFMQLEQKRLEMLERRDNCG